jgi:membrane-associated phospholipid phosphatase
MRSKIRYSYIIFLLVGFTQVWSQASWEVSTLKNIMQNRTETNNRTWLFISDTELPIFIGTPIITYGIGLWKKNGTLKKQGLYMAGSAIISTGLTTLVKRTVKRDRPYITYPEIVPLAYEKTHSFPSGHTSAAFCTATTLSLSFPKWYIAAPAYLWAGSMAYSRLHLGVHYPSDVVGGVVIGVGSAYLGHLLSKKLFRANTTQKQSDNKHSMFIK